MEKTNCSCAEGFTEKDGKKIANGLNVHDCRYIAQRNALIPEAIELADRAYKRDKFIEEPSWIDKEKLVKVSLWTREFTAKMNELYEYKVKVR